MGKVFTIVYSAIGVPLMMLFLANIGSSTATLIKFVYLRVNQCRRGLRSPLDLLRGNSNRSADLQQYVDDYADDDGGGGYEDDDEYVDETMAMESNKEAFYHDTAIFGGPPATGDHQAMMRFESEPAYQSRRRCSSSLLPNDFVTLTVGLRDIEVERSQLDKFICIHIEFI